MTECREKRSAVADDTLSGWSFAFGSMVVFLLPLILSVTCAAAAGDSDVRRFLAGLLGLIVGMFLGILAYKFISRDCSAKKEIDS